MGNCSNSKKKIITDSIKNINRVTEPNPPIERSDSFSVQSLTSRNTLTRVLLKSTSMKFEESLDVPKAKIIAKAKTVSERLYIKKSLSKHFLFNYLPLESLETIIDKMKMYMLDPNSIVFSQGNPGNCFFIIASGKLEVINDEKVVGTLTKGQSFGELALMHSTPRPSTVKTLAFSSLWGLTREDFRGATHSVNHKNYQEIKVFISSISLFDMLTPSQKEMLFDLLVPGEFKDGEKIVTEGEQGDLLFIIQKGMVRCTINGKMIRDMTKGDFFGEQALLYGTTRTATITAIKNVSTLSLHREHVVKVLGNQLQQVIYKNTQRMAMEKSPAFKDLTTKQREQIITSMSIKNYLPQSVIFQKGYQKGNKLYIIVKGSGTYLGKLYQFSSCFGDFELLKKPIGKYEGDLVCNELTDVAEISREELEKIIGGEMKAIIEKNIILSILSQVQLFRTLPLQKFELLISVLVVKEYQNNQFIFRQNDAGLNFFIIKEGGIDVIKDGNVIRTLGQFEYFGERAILFKENRTASAKATEKTTVWVLNKEDFLRVIDSGMRNQLLKRIELQDDTLRLEDLIPIRMLGKGTFGNVMLALNQKTNTLYAVKSVSRQVISVYSIHENLATERRLLMKVDHTFIVKLVKTLKDSDRIYFILEYIRGTGLFETLRSMELLQNDSSRFYIGSVILMLEHLHERSIIYRDLKPENLMVDEEGYLKLIDFGTAKQIDGKTFTVLGTPHYMAPEVILGKGYSFSADIWSLGIMSYEFVAGKVPFADEEQDPYKIYESILSYNYTYPESMRNNSRIKIFIDQLLSQNPNTRGPVDLLRSHKWFAGFNWDGLLSKKIHPPYHPVVDTLAGEIARSNYVDGICQAFEIEEDFVQNEEIMQMVSIKPVGDNWDKEF